MDLLAHLTNVDGDRKEQTLKEHCFHAAGYASENIGNAGLYHTAYLAGILHDAGKAKAEFAGYLEDAYQGKEVKRGSVNHTFAGVIWLFEKYHTDISTIWERMACEVISYAIGSHHGMFDCVDLDGENGFLHRLQKDREYLCYEETVHNYFTQVIDEGSIDEYFQKAVQEIKELFCKAKETYSSASGKVFFQISMLVRMVLSAVIYGDRRDTSEFMDQQKTLESSTCGWEKRRAYFESKLAQMDSSGMLNQIRRYISEQCLEAAERIPGIYRLNVPTGAGKTLCTLRFALAHAENYSKKRIIFIIPLLSVLDQNVKVVQEFLPDQREILEHHSNAIREEENGEEADRYGFLAESWNFPIIVSTLVQLLDILFSDGTSAAGRMQALCDSVIVIDEIQSLPKKTTVMFNMAMNFLQQYCNATIVLSSATQPCFEELKWPLKLAENPDLVRLDQEQLQIFKRAEIIPHVDAYGMDTEECAGFCMDRMEQYDSLLVVCNTKAEARTLFQKLQEQAGYQGWEIFHLSTAMCQEHRSDILERLKKSLLEIQKNYSENNVHQQKLICISTQLIEAGIDLSFACVVRVLAGIDNLAQAAGRCNRSNEYGRTGKVYLVNLKNENLSMLKEIKNAQDSTRKVLEDRGEEGGSLIEEQAARRFYRYLFEETKDMVRYPATDDGTTVYLADLLSNANPNAGNAKNKNYVLHQPFKTIGKKFTVFDQDTRDVLVPYGQGEDWIRRLEMMEKERFDFKKFKEIMEQLKKYTVSIYDWQRKKLDEAGLLYDVLEGRVQVLDSQAYDECFGLTIVEEQAVENYIL